MIAINVSQLLKQPPGTRRDFDFSEQLSGLAPEIELTRPVEGSAQLLRTSRGILVTSQYRTSVSQACGRCLGPAVSEIQGASSDEFLPKVDVVTGLVLEEQADSPELAIDERHVLDLSEVIRQDLLTRLPLRPLCEPDCPGLCPECGRELRTGGCTCERSGESGSPFANLAELLRRAGSDEPSAH